MTTFTDRSEVTLITSLGTDLTVANAARVSMDKHSPEFSAADAKLIGYLARHQHWTPFGHVQVQLRIATPVFVARQWMRSNVGVVRNEVSRRYVDSAPRYYLPPVLHERPSGSIKQGAGGEHPRSKVHLTDANLLVLLMDDLYRDMLKDGVAPEEARMILPLCHMTEFYETGSLAYFARVCALRLDPHAQGAVRDLAALVAEVVAGVAPVSWAALVAAPATNVLDNP